MKLNLSPAIARAKISQTALADAIGVNKGFMSEIISGKKSPSLEKLIAIAQVLNCAMTDLFDGGPETAAKPSDPPGFSEDQAAPFVISQRQDKSAADHAVNSLKASLRHGATYRMMQTVPWLGLKQDDILVVDLATKPTEGDLILIGVTNADGFNTRTTLRRFIGGKAVSADLSERIMMIDLETSATASWRATVRAVFRENP